MKKSNHARDTLCYNAYKESSFTTKDGIHVEVNRYGIVGKIHINKMVNITPKQIEEK